MFSCHVTKYKTESNRERPPKKHTAATLSNMKVHIEGPFGIFCTESDHMAKMSTKTRVMPVNVRCDVCSLTGQ